MTHAQTHRMTQAGNGSAEGLGYASPGGPGGPVPGGRDAEAGVAVTTDGLPAWLDPVARAARSVQPQQLSRFLPPESGAGRQSAVLVLFGEGERGPELLLMERSGTLRSHAGQPSFPGGALDPEDGDQATTGPCGRRCARPRRRPGWTPAAYSSSACCPGSTSRSAASS